MMFSLLAPWEEHIYKQEAKRNKLVSSESCRRESEGTRFKTTATYVDHPCRRFPEVGSSPAFGTKILKLKRRVMKNFPSFSRPQTGPRMIKARLFRVFIFFSLRLFTTELEVSGQRFLGVWWQDAGPNFKI
jgi:hypothetical protein